MNFDWMVPGHRYLDEDRHLERVRKQEAIGGSEIGCQRLKIDVSPGGQQFWGVIIVECWLQVLQAPELLPGLFRRWFPPAAGRPPPMPDPG